MNRASFGPGIDIITISVVNYSIELLNGIKINGLSRGLTDPMLAFEMSIRLAAFAGVFVLMAAWELLAPRRHQAAERPLRWSSNLGIVVLDTILVRILGGARRHGARRPAVRGGAQRHLDVQPRQRARPRATRPHVALDRGHAGHASRAPLRGGARDQQQFRLQSALVGPHVRHLPGATDSRPRCDDDRHRAVSRAIRAAPRPHAAAAVPRGRGPLSDRPS